MRPPSVRRPGFTLIELLLVISIIAILSMATFALFRAASTARSKARSKGDVQAISMACENYKKTYGDYPCRASVGNDDSFRKDMFDQLIGRRIIKSFPIAPSSAKAGRNDASDCIVVSGRICSSRSRMVWRLASLIAITEFLK